jgi:tRNA G10  N-methylase Trm11
MIIAILGRQPALGLAELESVYGADAVQAIGDHAASVSVEHVDPTLLGGTIKLAKPLVELPTTDWRKLASACEKQLPGFLADLPEGKLRLGLSVYGLQVTTQQLFRSGLELKKIGRAEGRSVRIVPATGLALNSAQVLHNQMTGPTGMELAFIKNGTTTWLAQTTWVQDVDDYARRDYGRPRRDAFVGMLPPKLAQIMLNLAGVTPGQRVLDPFCGTGVVLQEAALRGCTVYGTDLQERMVDFTRDNLQWLQEAYNVKFDPMLEVADATNARWRPPIDHIVCETYLGQPLSGLPKPEKLAEIMRDCDTIISKFLRNAHGQVTSGSRLCIAVPAWRVGGTFKHLPLLDRLKDLGYNRVRFQQTKAKDELVYHREDQIVARELLVLTVS